MTRMIADGELLLDQLGNTSSRPDRTEKAEGLRTTCEQALQLMQLSGAEQWPPTRSRMSIQSLQAIRLRPFEPLADGTLRNAERLGDAGLLPAKLVQLPGTQAPTFGPTNGLARICCAHGLELSTSRPMIIRSLCPYQ